MKKILISLLKVILVSCVISVALMSVFSLIMLKIQVSDTTLKTFVILIYAISTFFGGLIMGKVMESRKFLWGMGCGILYFAIILLLSVVMQGTGEVASLGIFVSLAVCLAGGTVGGMAG